MGHAAIVAQHEVFALVHGGFGVVVWAGVDDVGFLQSLAVDINLSLIHAHRVAGQGAASVMGFDAVGLARLAVRDEARPAADELQPALDEVAVGEREDARAQLAQGTLFDEVGQRGVHELRAVAAQAQDVADFARLPLASGFCFGEVADLVRDFMDVHWLFPFLVFMPTIVANRHKIGLIKYLPSLPPSAREGA